MEQPLPVKLTRSQSSRRSVVSLKIRPKLPGGLEEQIPGAQSEERLSDLCWLCSVMIRHLSDVDVDVDVLDRNIIMGSQSAPSNHCGEKAVEVNISLAPVVAGKCVSSPENGQ